MCCLEEPVPPFAGQSSMEQNSSDRRGVTHRSLWVFWGVLAGMGLGAALMWFGAYAYEIRVQGQHIHQLQAQLLKARTEMSQVLTQRDVLEGQLAVEVSTRKGLEATLGAIQQDLGSARDKIAFFEELLPAGPEGSIGIRALDIQKKNGTLEYRVLLMRHGTNTAPFEGVLQFEASGHLEGEPVTVVLQPVRIEDAESEPASSPVQVLALKFEQFQRSTGLLQIPAGLVLNEVTLNVLEGQILRVSRTVALG